MTKTVKNANNKSLQAIALNKAQLAQVKGGQNNFIIDDDIAGWKQIAPTGGKDFIVDDDLMGF